jgi:hypothetical protein
VCVAAIGLGLLSANGCGPSGPKTYPVKGKVVVKNGKLDRLVGGYVYMESVGEPKYKCLGEIDENGEFVMASSINDKPVEGMPEGDYLARVEPREGEYQRENEDDPIVVRKGQPLLKYQDYGTSGLKYKIEPRENTITIEVELKK